MEGSVWRRIAWIEFWLALFPPWGLWLLWNDPVLKPSTKRRVLFYTFFIPMVVLLAFSMHLMHVTEQAIKSAGGGY